MNDWKKLLISENFSVKQALKKMDEGAQKIVIVTASDMSLLGVLTDGDVRRHLLDNGAMTDSIAPIYNRYPSVLFLGDSDEEAERLLKHHHILNIEERSASIMTARTTPSNDQK